MNIWEEQENIIHRKNDCKQEKNDSTGIISETKNNEMQQECADITNKSGIYKIIHKQTGRYYVGSTKDFAIRWTRHKRELNKNKHINRHLQNAWNKYGEDSFEFVVVEKTINDKNILIETEQKYLDVIKNNPAIAFNLNYDAKGGQITEEGRTLISQKNAGIRNGMYGKTHSYEFKQKMKKLHKGNKYCLGRSLSLDHKKKISISNIGKKMSEKNRIALRDRMLQQIATGNINNKGTNSCGARSIKVYFMDGRIEKFDCIKYLFDKYPDKKYNNIQKLIRKEITKIKDISKIEYI